jgi:hypothetical protein
LHEIGGRLLVLQFKASNHVLKKDGNRRFHASHHQMARLQSLSAGHRCIFFEGSFESFWEFSRALGRSAVALVVAKD